MSRFDMTTKRFDNFKALAQFAATGEPVAGTGASRKVTYDLDWDNGYDFDKTMECLNTGYIWTDGVGMLRNSMNITEKLAARSSLPTVVRDVVGGAVSVGAFLAGHPRHMRRRQKAPAIAKPVLTIGVPIGAAWFVSSEQRANFGAALLSVCKVLERQGYRVEIDVLWRCGANNAYKHWINIEVPVKKATDRLNLASLSFAVMHSAMLRRACFGVAERVPAWEATVERSYGLNENDRKFYASLAADYDLYFGNMVDDIATACTTPEGAFKYVEEQVSEQLKRAADAAH